ncbi:hypothetical protein LTR17_012540 [Elasticomyces elasticus]|nr:hypothetical protein LTR17_012540 [Elasticomyces elasticus]
MRRCPQVWIDSICIDQSSNEDKDQQVQLMSKIYGQAVEVFVWLGDAHPDDDMAFEMLRSLPWIWPRGSSQYSIEGQGPLINEARRLWPVQEVILAVVVTINAGCESCEWGQLCQALEVLESINVDGVDLSGFPVPPQINLLRKQNPFPPWPLPYLFYVTLPLGTSEDKDHIFALRGLVATNDRDALRGTYDQVSLDLFQKLTLYLLGYSTLKEPCMSPAWVLAAAAEQHQVVQTTSAKPSWVLDGRAWSRMLVHDEYFISPAQVSSHCLELYTSPTTPSMLRVRGKLLTTIEASSHNCERNTTKRAFNFAISPRNGMDQERGMARLFLSEMRAFCRSQRSCASENCLLARILFAEARADLGRLCNDQLSDRPESRSASYTNWVAGLATALEDLDHKQQIYASRAPFLDRKVLSQLSDDRLAWIPDTAVHGDSIILLQGAPRPFVVHAASSDTYELVGDAEIPGLHSSDVVSSKWNQAREFRIV